MKLRTKYLLFVSILHGVALALSYFIFRENELLFIASEVLIIISAYIAWRFYNQLIQPLKTLMQGIEAIRDRDFNIKFISTGKYEMDELISVYNQMIDQLRLERTKQQEQHFFLEKLIHTSPTGILVLDYDQKVQQLNPKACQLLAVEERELKGMPIAEITLPVFKEISNLATGQAKTVTVNGVNTYKLQKSHFIDRGFPRYFVMIEELTTEILAAEKKAYGKVIRMMAHEVNNTVGPVNSIIESTLNSKSIWKTNNESLREALQVAFNRNHNLNLFMRNFADVVRLPQPQKKRIDLNRLIENMSTLMERKAGQKQIRFELQLSFSPLYIEADEQQMEQVILNIIKNAMEAIQDSGTITLLTDALHKTMIIRDTGEGIAEADDEQLFSPFFSTKKDGQGIGLTLVREILLNHQFSFSLKTVSPGRTEFSIQF
jgi:two-component system nitrogen regulation sensor histidine kinase NtrY